MAKQCTFTLQPDEKSTRSLKQCRAMHIMAAIMLVIYSLPYAFTFETDWIYLLAILLPALVILFIAIARRTLIEDANNNRIFRILEAGFLMMGSMHYLQVDQNIPALLYGLVSLFMLFLLWMESRLFQEKHIFFDEEKVEVEFPLGTRSYTWAQLHAVMLQSAIITLSFKDHTIHQLAIRPDYSELEAGDFLFFCQDCIRK